MEKKKKKKFIYKNVLKCGVRTIVKKKFTPRFGKILENESNTKTWRQILQFFVCKFEPQLMRSKCDVLK